jgi:anti-sigma regulatory factor (Ser/Thr protein kinase)
MRPVAGSAALRLPAEADALQGMRQWLEGRLQSFGLPPALRGQLVLATDEACMNIIQHAYGEQNRGEIRLSLELQPDRLIIELADDAPSIDPTKVKSRALNDVRPGGLGVHFIREIMDEMAFVYCGERGNRLRLMKRLGAA